MEVNPKYPFTQSAALVGGAMICTVVAVATFTTLPPFAIVAIIAASALAWVAAFHGLNAIASHLPDSLARTVRWTHAQTIEIFTLLALSGLALANVFHKPRTISKSDERPILLVHGYMNGGYVWNYQKRRLEKEFPGRVHVIDLGHPLRSIRYYARKVKEKAEEIAKKTGHSDLSLIGHSMGGVVSTLAATMAPPHTVRQVITIGSPLQGTRVAKIGPGACAREMEIDSSLLKEIHQAVSERKDIHFYHIVTKTDQLVVPYTSGLPFSEDQLILEDVGHASLLFSKRVADKICEWIRSA